MSLLGKILSIFGGESSDEASTSSKSERDSEPEPERDSEPEPEAEEAEAEAEEEEEGDENVPTKSVATAADPRRAEDEPNTVGNRAANPEDHESEGAEAEEAEAEEEEEGGDVPTKTVATAVDPRRAEDEPNTVENRAANPEDHEAEGAEAEEAEAEEEEEGDDVPTKTVATAADPRRSEDEPNTVENRAVNPDDPRATEAAGYVASVPVPRCSSRKSTMAV